MKKIIYFVVFLALTKAVTPSDKQKSQAQQELTAVGISTSPQRVQAPEIQALIQSNDQLVRTNAQLVKELNNRRDCADQFISCCSFLIIGVPRKCCNMATCSLCCSDHMCPRNNTDQF